MKSVVGEKGQVTIPKPLRKSLGLQPGTELEFQEEAGRLVGWRVVQADALGDLVGMLPPMDVDTELTRLRGAEWTADKDQRRRGHRRR